MNTALRRRYSRAGLVRGASLSDAVRAMRLYLGGVDYAGLRDQQRLYSRASQAASRVAKAKGMAAADVWEQIEAEARRQGLIRPVPGQHL